MLGYFAIASRALFLKTTPFGKVSVMIRLLFATYASPAVIGRVVFVLVFASFLICVAASPAFAQTPQSRFADVNGVRLHYLQAGAGKPVILLHGFAETSHMWLPLMSELQATHNVIAVDLRGAGDSSAPATGYTKAQMAVDIHELAKSLGFPSASLVGHDIGLMVAYAYAAQYPKEVSKIALMDAFLLGVGNWRDAWLTRDHWHFHFYGETPLALVKGRARTYLDHFWNDFAADRRKSVSERDRQLYASEYAKPNHMLAGFEWFHSFEQDAADNARFAKVSLTMPMLVIAGGKASGQFLINQARLVASNVEGVVIPDSGHWLMEEAPVQTTSKLVEFLNR